MWCVQYHTKTNKNLPFELDVAQSAPSTVQNSHQWVHLVCKTKVFPDTLQTLSPFKERNPLLQGRHSIFRQLKTGLFKCPKHHKDPHKFCSFAPTTAITTSDTSATTGKLYPLCLGVTTTLHAVWRWGWVRGRSLISLMQYALVCCTPKSSQITYLR